MVRLLTAASVALFLGLFPSVAPAQGTGASGITAGEIIQVGTVTRPPFSFLENGEDTGFSIELWEALADGLGIKTEFVRTKSFTEMLDSVREGRVGAAVANISITADREAEMDFSQPIFDSGLRIMVPEGPGSRNSSLLGVLFSWDLAIAIAAAFGLLFFFGMLMWFFERKHQPYFDQPANKAVFPAFWWALNLVVNGGFEERQPRSTAGRLLGVAMVIASLFLVSVFVARITTMMTVDAIQSSVASVGDLYGKRVGTIADSTAAGFLERRDIRYSAYPDLDSLIDEFETGNLDAVVFDAPILAYYANTSGKGIAQLVGQIFLPENYGIALPTGSPLAEPINQGLLKLREDGTYESIRQRWFGPQGG